VAEDSQQDTTQDTTPDRRVTIQEAARRLGVKEDAIRKRIQRGTLRHEKTEEGRVLVWVDAAQDATQDVAQDPYHDTAQDALRAAKDETITELRDRVGSLERSLEQEREARRRADTIIAQLTQANAALTSRVPELPPGPGLAPSQQPSESLTVGSEEPQEASREHRPAEGKAQRATSRARRWLIILAVFFLLVAGALLVYFFVIMRS
jgi:excisionase family DNA binding protein